MTSAPIMALGFLIGMQHALEADHIAAVSSIAARGTRTADVVKHGLSWGLGHTLTLFSFAGAAMLLGWAIPDILARFLEGAVGVMLVGLGAHVLWGLRDGMHLHQYPNGTQHIHAHCTASPPGNVATARETREHGLRWRSLAVGLMHGMAGSAALLVVAVSQVADPMQGVAYVVLFGLGSMIVMGALSSVIAVPLVASAHSLTQINRGIQAAIGLVTIGIGATTICTILTDTNVLSG